MTSHSPPSPARSPRVVWVIAFGAVVGIVGPPVVALAQTVAPQVAAQTALAWPEQTPEPVGHGGLGGELALPSVGAVTPTTTTERNDAWLAATADVAGPGSRKPTAPSATSTSAPSEGSTATDAPGGVNTPQESPHEQAGAFSGAPTDPSGTPGSSTPIESTPSTQSASPSGTTPPDPTEPSAPDTTTPTETTATTEETDVTVTMEATP